MSIFFFSFAVVWVVYSLQKLQNVGEQFTKDMTTQVLFKLLINTILMLVTQEMLLHQEVSLRKTNKIAVD